MLIALLVGACAAPAAAPDDQWQLPVCPKGAEELSMLYEPSTATLPPDGLAVLSCTAVGADRALACSVEQEAPLGYGFGAVALQFSEGLRLCDETPDQAEPFSLRFPFKNQPSGALRAALEVAAKPAPSP